MIDPIEPQDTLTPGPRRQITLDIAERAIDGLVAGEDATRFGLRPNPDGSYTLWSTGTVGQARAAGITPVGDVLVNGMNELIASINANIDKVPEEVLATLDKITREYRAYNGS